MSEAEIEVCAGVSVSRETFAALKAFEALVEKWSPKINLISRNDLRDIWSRHIIDSAQIFGFCRPSEGLWADFGSGGGFPAIVLAILSEGAQTNTRFALIESDARKAVFLRTAAREIGLRNVEVLNKRIEELPPMNADVISARALANLTTLLEFSERHLADTGRAVFQKGETAQREVEVARNKWEFSVQSCPSQTNPTASILLLKDIQRA